MSKQLEFFTDPLPTFSDYDWIVVNSSGGKDSQTTLDYVCNEAQRQHFPINQMVVAHADLGRVEWPGAAELAHTQASCYGIEYFWKMKRPQGDLLQHVKHRKMWPAPHARYCTSDHKRAQLNKLHVQLGQKLSGEKCKILNCMGMRREESDFRAKLPTYSLNKRASTKTRQVYDWLPIIDWGIDEVWQNIKVTGVPYHYAYDLGMPRLSCVFCIYAPKEALQLAGRHNPQLLADYVKVENEIGHKFTQKISLKEVQKFIGNKPELVSTSNLPDWSM